MKFSVTRVDIVAVQAVAPPLFGLPARAPEVFEALYGALNQEFPMRPADMQMTGGTAYSDLKVSVKSGDGVQVDIGANGFYAHMRNAQDKESFRRLVTKVEEILQTFFPRTAFIDSVLRLHGWLQCEGEAAAVDALLAQRGQLAFTSKSFGDYAKEFTFRIDMKKADDTQAMTMLFQRALSGTPGHLYADANFQFNKGYPEKRLAAQLETAFTQLLQILADAGFEEKKT